MNIVNEARLAFMSRSANESFARVAVSGFFMQLDPTVDELTDIKTAVSEAVTNAIVHGYGLHNDADPCGKRRLCKDPRLRLWNRGCEKGDGAIVYDCTGRGARRFGLCGHAVVHGYGTCAFGNGEGHDRRDDQGAPHPDR